MTICLFDVVSLPHVGASERGPYIFSDSYPQSSANDRTPNTGLCAKVHSERMLTGTCCLGLRLPASVGHEHRHSIYTERGYFTNLAGSSGEGVLPPTSSSYLRLRKKVPKTKCINSTLIFYQLLPYYINIISIHIVVNTPPRRLFRGTRFLLPFL